VEGVLIGTFFSFLLLLTVFFVTMESARRLSITHYLVLSRLRRNYWLVRHGNEGGSKEQKTYLIKKEWHRFP